MARSCAADRSSGEIPGLRPDCNLAERAPAAEFMECTFDPREDQRRNSNGNGGAMLYKTLCNIAQPLPYEFILRSSLGSKVCSVNSHHGWRYF